MTPDSGPLTQVTAADVLRWGRAQAADTVVGVCRDPRACLIASYALHVLGIAVAVSPMPWFPCYRQIDDNGIYLLPPDLGRLALDFDALADPQILRACGPSARAIYPADLDRLEATP